MTKEQAYDVIDAAYNAALKMQKAKIFTDTECSGYYAGLLKAYELAMSVTCQIETGE